MAAPHQAKSKLLLLLVTLCVCCPPATSKKNKTPWLEWILQDMSNGYNKYARTEGNPKTMSCQEFREYLKAENPSYIESNDPEIVEKTFASMDVDKDGEMNYKEFFQFLAQYMVTKYYSNSHLHA